MFEPPPPGPCKPGKKHRFTVMSSRRGYKNCWHCGQTVRVTKRGKH